MGILSIDGTELPFAPTKMAITKSDLYSDSTQRSSETGHLLMHPIRRDIYTIELEFLLNTEQKKLLDSLLDNQSRRFNVVFQENDKMKGESMYPSDRSIELLGTPENRQYRISFSFIQI